MGWVTAAAGYCMGDTVALGVNGSLGGAAVVCCQIVFPAFTANDLVPVEPNVCGVAVASHAEFVAVPLQSFGPAADPAPSLS